VADVPSRNLTRTPDAPSADLHYPLQLVAEDPEFAFPAAEGVHPHCQSDTWFLAGELTAATSGRRFAFLTIFNQNRPGGTLVADFHTWAVFDLDNRTYGTFTDYDMPPKNMEPGTVHKMSAETGHLEISFASRAGQARWTARRDADGELEPFTYEVSATHRIGHPPTGTGRRIDLQRALQLSRAARDLLLFPDRHGDDRHAHLGW